MIQEVAQACTQHSVAILVMLGTAFGFGLLLGYFLWHKYVALAAQHSAEREEWREKYVSRDAAFQQLELEHRGTADDLNKLRDRHTEVDLEARSLRAELDTLRETAARGLGSAPLAERSPNDKYAAVGMVPKSELVALQKRYDALAVELESRDAELAMLSKRRATIIVEEASAKTSDAAPDATPPAAPSLAESFVLPEGGPVERPLSPAVIELLRSRQVYDWADLAALEPSELQSLLASAEHYYVPAQFSVWIAQARRIVGDTRPVKTGE